MTRSHLLLVVLVAALPVEVEAPGGADSTSVPVAWGTRLRVAGGTGSYAFVARGCEGEVLEEVPVRFRDASVSLDQRLGSTPIVIGARGGWVREKVDTSSSGLFPDVPLGQTITNRYVNPYVEIDGGRAALGIGYVFHQRDFLTAGETARLAMDHPLNDYSLHFRLGYLDRKYFLIRWMESEPLISGGGYLTAGMGGRVLRTLRLYGGMGAGGPYEGAGLMLSGSLDVVPGVRLAAAGRVGLSGKKSASGGSIGLEIATGER